MCSRNVVEYTVGSEFINSYLFMGPTTIRASSSALDMTVELCFFCSTTSSAFTMETTIAIVSHKTLILTPGGYRRNGCEFKKTNRMQICFREEMDGMDSLALNAVVPTIS